MPMRTRSLATAANSWACSMTSNGVLTWAEVGVATIHRIPRAAAGLKLWDGFLATCLVAFPFRRGGGELWTERRALFIGTFLLVRSPLFRGGRPTCCRLHPLQVSPLAYIL